VLILYFFIKTLSKNANNQIFIEVIVSYEETADILLIDYFTYIGGLFGLWFKICLESLLDLIVKHTRDLRTKVKLKVEKHLSFLYISSLH
jgi:hypothetical protein